MVGLLGIAHEFTDVGSEESEVHVEGSSQWPRDEDAEEPLLLGRQYKAQT